MKRTRQEAQERVRGRRLIRVFGASVALVCAFSQHAAEISPPASEWRSYCQSYLAALDQSAEASDLDITYCIGVTKGLLNGMRIGAQLGALSFGSRLAVQYELDPDEVFKLFQGQPPAQLLGVCSPPDQATQDFVRVTLRHLEDHPGHAERPIAEVMYEALRDAYPCD